MVVYVLIYIFYNNHLAFFFLFFYNFKKEYFLENSQSKHYGWGSRLSKFFFNLVLLEASIGISLLLFNIIVSKIIAIFSQDYFIALFLISIFALAGLYMPIIFFRFFTKKKISLSFDRVLILYMLLSFLCFGLPAIFWVISFLGRPL